MTPLVVKFILWLEIPLILTVVLGTSSPIKETPKKLTPLEIELCEKLRLTLGNQLYRDFMKTNEYLVPWIRDQAGDVEKAKTKLERSLQWRIKNDIDTVVNEDFSDILRLCPFDITGKDRVGSPILQAALGQCSLRKLSLSGKRLKLQRAIYYLMELIALKIRENQKESKIPQQAIVLCDMQGLSAREHLCLACLSFFGTMFDAFVNHYPDVLKGIYVVNDIIVPNFGVGIMRPLFEPLVPPTWRNIFHFHGFDRQEWQKDLESIVDPSQLISQLGGTKNRRNNTRLPKS